VLKRSEATAQQIRAAFDRMAALRGIEACGPRVLAELQSIDAGSSYIQLVGTVQDEAIVCSSYGLQVPAWPLGPVDYTSALGLRVRTDVRFPFSPDEPYVVTSDGRFAAVVHKALPVDSTVTEPGVSLAIVSASQGRPLATRGEIDPAWTSRGATLPAGGRRIDLVDGTMVAQMRSANYDLLSVAALADVHYGETVAGFAMVMAPFGVLAGALLSWILLRLMRAQMSLPATIRAGLRNREFFIELQPIVRLSDRRWVGAEVLMRWRRPDGRMIRPDLFIAAAEDAGMIRLVTGRVLELAKPALRALAGRGDGLFLSVNLASDDLHDDTMPECLAGLLRDAGADASLLHVEITERAFVDVARARRQLDRIRALGIQVSIDDFGTGYSSLSELVGLEVDALKIDKAFVDTIGSDAVTSQVAAHIVEMAHSLSIAMIAEGIEHSHQADTLAAWRVQYGQGWLFSRSVAVEAFLAALPGGATATGVGREAGALPVLEG
jgi:sensor c-di-GMP phosphodiesterase-like protein